MSLGGGLPCGPGWASLGTTFGRGAESFRRLHGVAENRGTGHRRRALGLLAGRRGVTGLAGYGLSDSCHLSVVC